MTQKQLTEEELNKVTGGANVGSLGGHSVNDYHDISFSGGWLTLTIIEIDDSKNTPFHVEEKRKYSSNGNENVTYSWMSLDDLNYFWNKSSLG